MSTESPNTGRSFGEWVRYIWAEGLARHVIIEKAAEGKRPVNLPLTFVLIGAVLAPWLMALGVIAAVLLGYSIRIEGGGDSAGDSIEDAVNDASDAVDDTVSDAADEAEGVVADAAEKAQEAADAVEDTVEEAVTGLEAKIEGEEPRT